MQRVTSTLSALDHASTARWRQLLSETFAKAQQQATRLDRPVIASVTVAANRVDPIAYFMAAEGQDAGFATYWERPAQREALVGIGNAATIETPNADAIATVARRWHILVADAVVAHESALEADRARPLALGDSRSIRFVQHLICGTGSRRGN